MLKYLYLCDNLTACLVFIKCIFNNLYLISIHRFRITSPWMQIWIVWTYSAQEVFKFALRSSKIRLRVISAVSSMAGPATSWSSSTLGGTTDVIRSPEGAAGTQQQLSLGDDEVDQPSKTSNSLRKKLPPPVPERTTSAGVSKATKFAPISSTRLIGHVTTIDLVKGEWLRHWNVLEYRQLLLFVLTWCTGTFDKVQGI